MSNHRHLYKPMLAKPVEKPFSGIDWVFEIKWDGFRAIAYIEEPFSLKSRNQKELKHNFPELEQLKHLAHSLVVDGEIVVMKNGKPDFQTLLERGQSVSQREIERQMERAPAVYIVFDVLEKDGVSLTGLPLVERKRILKESLAEGSNVLVSDFIEENGEAYYQLVLEKGLEGVVAKLKDSYYEEGMRSGSWLKIKQLKTCDCIIFGYTSGGGVRGKTFGALLLGVYDKEGKAMYLGKVGTGFNEQTLGTLMDKFEKIKTDVAPFKAEVGDVVTWLEPKLVCEVVYQVLTRDFRLRMPRFRGLRQDKPPQDCTIDQFMEVKSVPNQDSGEKLSEYKSKRDFAQTSEPQAEVKESGGSPVFVVQEHHSRRLHWDFRLESGGVLKSWAVPKGIPEDTKQRHLAVETEDHPLEYANFAGTIPKGQYGAGTVVIWDKGHYTVKEWLQDKIEVILDGERLKGRYVLVRLKRGDEKNWLMLKGKE
ncbi:MAG: non-homologous end-joining DNA ligase [Candidatus Bathyarchaeia archaeon]|jgi:DNA ligase D-like protein (predicted ligase)/DNA ligase D-like protein (predicted 3'-phosphoesterase)